MKVTILTKTVLDDYIEYQLKVDHVYWGEMMKDGDVFVAGKTTNPEYQHLLWEQQFLTLDSHFTYVMWESRGLSHQK